MSITQSQQEKPDVGETESVGSRLEHVLRSGEFAVTAELSSPDSADPDAVYERARLLAGVVDAINASDAPSANVHLSPTATATLLVQRGYEVVMHMTCRDRNRIAIQGDLLGAAALGIRNVLCLTGDDVTGGDQPEAKRVFDLDSLQLLCTLNILRKQGTFLSGRKLDVPPKFFVGAGANPFAPPYDWRPLRLAKKVEAGAEFIQTQFCFDIERLRQFMHRVRDMGLHEKVFILVGLGPLTSEKMAEFMRSQIPGIVVPDHIVERLRRAPKGKKRQEGKRICVETIQQVREIDGVAGIHVMAYRREELAAEIIEEAKISPLHRDSKRV